MISIADVQMYGSLSYNMQQVHIHDDVKPRLPAVPSLYHLMPHRHETTVSLSGYQQANRTAYAIADQGSTAPTRFSLITLKLHCSIQCRKEINARFQPMNSLLDDWSQWRSTLIILFWYYSDVYRIPLSIHCIKQKTQTLFSGGKVTQPGVAIKAVTLGYSAMPSSICYHNKDHLEPFEILSVKEAS